MANISRIASLEIDQDLNFQRSSWVVQRVGWIFMALVALAALLGLLGSGPLSRTTIRSHGDVLEMTYNRFIRYQAPLQLRVRLDPDGGHRETASVWLSRPYLESVSVHAVTPSPQSVEAGGNQLTYIFRLSEPSQPITVVFELVPQKFGMLSGSVGQKSGQPLNFRQFVYP